MSDTPRLRHSVRVLLLDEEDRLLLFRGEEPETGAAFWFPAGGGVAEGEDIRAAAAREVAETGLVAVPLRPEVWRRRHVFSWRGARWDQRERWFMARVQRFEPYGIAMTEVEKTDLMACRWWTLEEMDATAERLVPRDLAVRLRRLLAHGPPRTPIEVGIDQAE